MQRVVIPTSVIALVAAVAVGLGTSAVAQPGPGYGPGMMGGQGSGYGRFGGPASSSSAPSGDAAQGRQLTAGKCAACHGPDGNGVSALPQYPKLAGQNPTYLYRQILAFKSGARKSDVMTSMVAGLSDADAADVARFYGDQPVKPDPVENSALATQGARIFNRSPGPRTPACGMCHRPNQRMPMMSAVMGVNPADIPVLYGQHAAYILDQLNRYASGARPDGVMNGYAAALSESDRKAVATYLSGLR